jgi:Anti-sigma-28 factor, FlgM
MTPAHVAGLDRFKEEHRMTPLLSAPEVRQELIARIRQEIQAGTYDTAEKFEAALERMTAQLDVE